MFSSATSYTVSVFILEWFAFVMLISCCRRLLAILSLYRSLKLLLGLLDGPQQSYDQLFGVTHGMAMGVLTFDWGQISYNHFRPVVGCS